MKKLVALSFMTLCVLLIIFHSCKKIGELENDDTTDLFSDILSPEAVEFFDNQPTEEISLNDIILPNGENLLDFMWESNPEFFDSYPFPIDAPKKLRQSKSGIEKANNTLMLKNTLIGAIQLWARGLAHNPNHTQMLNDGKEPKQLYGLGYSYGSRQYDVRQKPPQGTCTEQIYGLDCSGFLWRAALGGGLKLAYENAVWADDLRKTETWEKSLKEKGKEYEEIQVKTYTSKEIDVSKLEAGDIIYFMVDNVAKHIGIVSNQKGVGALKLFQSNGTPNPLNGKDCSHNYSENRGTRAISLLNPMTWKDKKGNPIFTDWGIVRLIVDDEEAQIREILMRLYNETGGANWINNTNWCSEKPINEWYGIAYTKGSLIINLSNDSRGNNLRGNINLSGCTVLKELHCSDDFGLNSKNQLISINVSDCTALEALFCDYNFLTSLNVSNCTNLKSLGCRWNHLSSLNVSTCTNLINLAADVNQLVSLDVSKNILLETLYCGGYHYSQYGYSDIRLTQLDVSKNTKLGSLGMSTTNITTIDVSKNTNLEYLHISRSSITEVNVSNNKKIRRLELLENKLISLNVSNLPLLEVLWCRDNQLTNLNAQNCPALQELNCQNNNISSEIPTWMQQLYNKSYDIRYTYNSQGYTDNGKGWWYSGEPKKGYHGL
jgi:hypothetical protein